MKRTATRIAVTLIATGSLLAGPPAVAARAPYTPSRDDAAATSVPSPPRRDAPRHVAGQRIPEVVAILPDRARARAAAAA
ncbi:hypothetical protein [Demequina silvatica]|uniref:hypothetical protein n=1 Tax=Demequina silvatica TaxID=1638988 RepID=UPI0007818CDD|nr:hypothetical protein [Demequina silvatica]